MAAYQNSVPLKNEIISLEINRGGTTKFVRVFDQRKRVEEGNKKKKYLVNMQKRVAIDPSAVSKRQLLYRN